MPQPTLRLYDTLSRQVKPLETQEPGHLRFYSCGPTVYSYAHIGNFRTFLTGDLVIRTAEALGWRVSYVTNITDVGHLTADDLSGQDGDGEDRMVKALRSKEGARFANVWDLAEHYTETLKDDWARLNLREPMVRPRATQHMTGQIKAVEALIDKGYAYETPTGVYFSVQSFSEYGKLSGNRDQEQLMRAVREVVTDDNKRHPADFALWKKDPKHLMQWYSPFGWGFPGWHIECSVMAQEYLGDTVDLHGGGEDLIFPHHECEVAQSESLTGKPFATHWIHTRFLQVEGQKMAKSAGNFFTVRDLVEDRGADPLALRYALISGVYRQPFNFTLQLLEDAIKNVGRFRQSDEFADRALAENRSGEDTIGADLDALYDACLEAMCDDLNTAVALAKALEGTRVILREGDSLSGASSASAKRFLDQVNALLGIVRQERPDACAGMAQGPKVDEAWVQGKIEERQAAKKAKDFSRADAIRDELANAGVELRDTPQGPQWALKARL